MLEYYVVIVFLCNVLVKIKVAEDVSGLELRYPSSYEYCTFRLLWCVVDVNIY
jgi:hypothetical protein